MTDTAPELILASQSESRRVMLTAAGVAFTAVPAEVDEAALKRRHAAAEPHALATILAEAKARAVAARFPDALVLGSDSLVALADGTLLDKPIDREDAADHLRRMRGGRHAIVSAAVLVRGDAVVWRHADAARLVVRAFSDPFLEAYLDREWPAIAGCVGCFRLEGPGVQLFERIAGDHFTVLGLPLLPVLDALRAAGVLTA